MSRITHLDVAGNVRAELARRRLKQTDLAPLLGLTQQATSRRLTGVVPFSTVERSIVAEFFALPVADLLGTAPAVAAS